MLDPKKLEQACRDALAFLGTLRGLKDRDVQLIYALRDALNSEVEALSADEARKHRGFPGGSRGAGHGVIVATCNCSCGQKFEVRRLDSSDAAMRDADWQARRMWLQHLEEMRIRGLLS